MTPRSSVPRKPIGGFMDEEEARRREATMGWSVVEDAGRGWRRVVASPMPKEVVELDTVTALINAGVVVISVGGGGIPVIDRGAGEYVGIAAVIDKDYASSLLAQSIKADLFLISTGVEKVALNFGKPDQQFLDRMTVSEARRYLAEGTHFAKGSMAPKIEAILGTSRPGASTRSSRRPRTSAVRCTARQGPTSTLIEGPPELRADRRGDLRSPCPGSRPRRRSPLARTTPAPSSPAVLSAAGEATGPASSVTARRSAAWFRSPCPGSPPRPRSLRERCTPAPSSPAAA